MSVDLQHWLTAVIYSSFQLALSVAEKRLLLAPKPDAIATLPEVSRPQGILQAHDLRLCRESPWFPRVTFRAPNEEP